MQTLTEIKQILAAAGLTPQKRFGQNFLIDKNLLAKVLELAELDGQTAVLEVGPGTGTLTEELLERSPRVVAAEIDRGFCQLLQDRLGARDNFRLVCGDVLAGKHAVSPAVLAELFDQAMLVSNLPYNIATPLISQCLEDSWRKLRAVEGAQKLRLFSRLTFTVQKEVADRFASRQGSDSYGPVSVLTAAMATMTLGPVVPGSAFWPRPNVDSRIARIDFDPARASAVKDAGILIAATSLCFAQRRKKLCSVLKRDSAFDTEKLAAAMTGAGIDLDLRPEQVEPEKFIQLANLLCSQ